jgi:hypothetical protein
MVSAEREGALAMVVVADARPKQLARRHGDRRLVRRCARQLQLDAIAPWPMFEHDLRANVFSFAERETGFLFSGSCA